MKVYPKFFTDEMTDLKEVIGWIRYVNKERPNDVNDFTNLQNRFMAGRKVAKVPTGASDVDPSDRVGDFNYDVSYWYILVDNAGTAEWRRAALASW